MQELKKIWAWASIPLFFYLELWLGGILVVLLPVALGRRTEEPGTALRTLLVIVFCLALAFCLYRMWGRFQRAKALHGLSALGGFTLIAMFVLPVWGVATLGRDFEIKGQTKARQSEAKIALAATFGAQKAYFSQHGRYSPRFYGTGYSPEGSRRRYAVRIVPHCGEAPDPGFSMLENHFAKGREQEIEEYFRKVEQAPCRDVLSGFEAYAVGVIREGGPLDVWKIDEQKNLVQVSGGL